MSQIFSFSTVDVFTTECFKGNQLAIVHLPRDTTLNQETKQKIAQEFTYSETVFLHDSDPADTLDDRRRLDIFTVKGELPFAGHPVIGTVCYVCQTSTPPIQDLRLNIKAGPITATYDTVKGTAKAEIPHNVHIHSTYVPSSAVTASQPCLEHLTEPELRTSFPLVSIVKGVSYILIQLPWIEQGLGNIEPARQKIVYDDIALDDAWGPSFIASYYYVVLSAEDNTVRLRTRMLEPAIGEDAATGSAASALASYLALRDGRANKTLTFLIEQGVEMGRASQLEVEVRLNDQGSGISTVTLGGSAVIVTRGTLHVSSV